jgi:hypothetical protein
LLGTAHRTENLAESIAAVAHGHEFQLVARPAGVPSPANGFRRGPCGERSFEFIRDNDYLQTHFLDVEF